MSRRAGNPVHQVGDQPPLSNLDTVLVAVYLLGGDGRSVDTEDIAIKTNEIAPGRFTWAKHPDQINIHLIMTHLWDAKSERKGGLVVGSEKEGWMLTAVGLEVAKKGATRLGTIRKTRRLSPEQKQWQKTDRRRVLNCEALAVYRQAGLDAVTRAVNRTGR